jgi:hypothetical protein
MLGATLMAGVGLAAPAVGQAASKLINGKQLKANTVTGKQIKESTLGTVPHAKLATSLPPLVWHPLTLINGWTTYNAAAHRPAYAIDAQGIVHLEGVIMGGPNPANDQVAAFVLPPAASPRTGSTIDLPVESQSGAVADLEVFKGGGYPTYAGSVTSTEVQSQFSLEGVSFAIN